MGCTTPSQVQRPLDEWLADCHIPTLRGRLESDLIENRNEMYWSLEQCNIDKQNLRNFYDDAK